MNYKKWDAIATRVTQHEEGSDDDEIAEYSWVEMPHADIRVRIPVWVKTKSKMCKVVVKLNWLTVYAPPTEAVVDYYRSALRLVRHGKERDVRPFTMLEIGAGFGFWTLTTHAALRQLWKTRHSDLPRRRLPPLRYNYTLVEIDHAKQDLLQTVLAMNNIDTRHASVVHAALGLRDEAEGAVQDGIAGWYAVYSCDTHSSGGACAQKGFNVPEHKRANRTVLAQQKGAVADMVSLPTLLRPYTIVDLVDMDVQAAEFKVLNGSAGAHDAKRALDALDEPAAETVQGERTGHLNGFTAGDVAGDLDVGRGAEMHCGGAGVAVGVGDDPADDAQQRVPGQQMPDGAGH